VSIATASYKGHRYPVEIINHCVWLYFRFFAVWDEIMPLQRPTPVISGPTCLPQSTAQVTHFG
jgi:putative transposase